ncbi:hypothetical protein PDJAM_G00162300, partial [Pangasius djambal]|nr:hypothetical protein [Pangasius djambal]
MTNDEKLKTRKESQAVNSLTVHAYASVPGSKNYLHIGLLTEELEFGNQFFISMNILTPHAHKNHDITYMIISKGQI